MSTYFPVCPRKRTSLPILELLPPPALRECRHRGLARRLVAVRRRAVRGEGLHPWRAGPRRRVELRGVLLEPGRALLRCDRGGGDREHAELLIGELQHGGDCTTRRDAARAALSGTVVAGPWRVLLAATDGSLGAQPEAQIHLLKPRA